MKALPFGSTEKTVEIMENRKEDAKKKEQDNKVLKFPKDKKKVMDKTLKRYNTQTIALSDEEKDALEVLSMWSGIKPASLARSIYYRGVEAFLNDKKLQSGREEAEVFADVDKLINTDKEMQTCRTIIESRKTRTNQSRKTG